MMYFARWWFQTSWISWYFHHTVDWWFRNSAPHVQKSCKNWINYQPQLVFSSDFWTIYSMFTPAIRTETFNLERWSLKIGRTTPPKNNLPTIHFQVRTVSSREGAWIETFNLERTFLGGGFNYSIFYFYPYLGRWSNLTNIYQMGWNHQLVFVRPLPRCLNLMNLPTSLSSLSRRPPDKTFGDDAYCKVGQGKPVINGASHNPNK